MSSLQASLPGKSRCHLTVQQTRAINRAAGMQATRVIPLAVGGECAEARTTARSEVRSREGLFGGFDRDASAACAGEV